MTPTATRIAALASVLLFALVLLAAAIAPRLQSAAPAPLGASAASAARLCTPCDTPADPAAPARPAPSLHDAATFVLPLCGVA
jgi:hypothetical protein